MRQSHDSICQYPRSNYKLQQYPTGAAITMAAGTGPVFQKILAKVFKLYALSLWSLSVKVWVGGDARFSLCGGQ